jgi:hypothetical protein
MQRYPAFSDFNSTLLNSEIGRKKKSQKEALVLRFLCLLAAIFGVVGLSNKVALE